MSASRQEVQIVTDQLFALLGLRMSKAGQLTLHFSEGGVYQRCELNMVMKPGPDRPMRRSDAIDAISP